VSEETGHAFGTPARALKVVVTQKVRLQFVGAAVFLKGEKRHRTSDLSHDACGGIVSEQHPAGFGQQRVNRVHSGELVRRVPADDVTNLMADDSRKFRLVPGPLDQPTIDIEISSRQRKRVDVGGVDHSDCVVQLGSSALSSQSRHESGEVRLNHRHIDESQLVLLLDGCRNFGPERDLLRIGHRVVPWNDNLRLFGQHRPARGSGKGCNHNALIDRTVAHRVLLRMC
jgi:hypothetical protein